MDLCRLIELADRAGVKEDQFGFPELFQPWLYYQVIRCLIRDCWADSPKGYDITSSEYCSNESGEICDITLVLEYSGGNGARIQDLRDSLRRNIELIPSTFRSRFRAWIGCNGDENGALLVDIDGVRVVSPAEWNKYETEDCFVNQVMSAELYPATGRLLEFIQEEYRSKS